MKIQTMQAPKKTQVYWLYNDGWGYHRIANHLTDRHYPTPRMSERARSDRRSLTNNS